MRCINIDWLEVYCLESVNGFPHDVSYFTSCGYVVREREYGTRVYEQMFTILDRDLLPFIEVRRKPVSSMMKGNVRGIFSQYSCHLRLSNRYCYHPQAVQLFRDFLERHGYDLQRIFRLDLCLDFELFDKGDEPYRFLQRYLRGVYCKTNRCYISAHGRDYWVSRDWTSLSWGSPKSMVGTKIYDKTKELAEAKDKPYIRYAWQQAGLVDDYINLTKRRDDGSVYRPRIWRVEFSIRSSARFVFVLEDETHEKPQRTLREHRLETYETKQLQLNAFATLARHYFSFKHYREGVRKDRCPDKVLFDFTHDAQPYRMESLLGDNPASSVLEQLKKKLLSYRLTCVVPQTVQAIDVILTELQRKEISLSMADPYDITAARIIESVFREKFPQGNSRFNLPANLLAMINSDIL